MSTFFMFGKYSSESTKEISAERTRKVTEIVRQFDGEIRTMYALMGAYDIVLIVNFPTMEQALKVSVMISQALGISFSTLPAIEIEEFDKLIGKK